VQSILKNEKYAGNAILQKGYTIDFLTKKRKKNEGEVPQYFVENSHPAIIEPEIFELVQEEIRRRAAIGKQLSGSGAFVCKIVCSDCGGFYGSKVWHSNSEYRRFIWRCNRKYLNDDACQTPHLTEDEIKIAFVQAWNQLIAGRNRYIAEYEAAITDLTEDTAFDERSARLKMECAETIAAAEVLIAANASTSQDQERFRVEHDTLVARYDAIRKQLEAISLEKQERAVRREKIRCFIDLLKHNTAAIAAFDEKLWNAAVEIATVQSVGNVTVTFKSGTEISVGLPK
jgi:hypothetical protein